MYEETVTTTDVLCRTCCNYNCPFLIGLLCGLKIMPLESLGVQAIWKSKNVWR